jgi:hypothetical protein
MNYIQTYYSNVVETGVEKAGLWLSVFTAKSIDADLFLLMRSGDAIIGKKRWPSARYCLRVVFKPITDHDIEHGVGLDDDDMKMIAPDNFAVVQANLAGGNMNMTISSAPLVFDYATSDDAWKNVSRLIPNTVRRATAIGVFDSILDYNNGQKPAVKGIYFNDIDMFWLSKDACKIFRVAHNKRIINPHMGKVDFSVEMAPDVLKLKKGLVMDLITYKNKNNPSEYLYKEMIRGPVPVFMCSAGIKYKDNQYISSGAEKKELMTLGEDINLVAIVVPCSFADVIELEKIVCYAMNNGSHTFLFVDGTLPFDINDASLKYILIPSMKQRIDFIESFSYELQ